MTVRWKPIGVGALPLENRLPTLRHMAMRAAALGYTNFSLPETWAYDVPVLLASLAAETQHIQLGATILSVWNRSAATIAMAAVTLQAVSGGRFVLGLGASTPQLAEGLHDTAFDAPYEQLRRMVSQVSALLGGERIGLTNGRDARPLRLNVPEITPPPILMGAVSPRSIRLAGELCDGWIPFLYPRDRLAEGIGLFHEGRAQSDNPERPAQIWPSLPTVIHADADKARTGAAWFIAFYITTMGTIYRDALKRMGFAAEVDAVIAANQDRRPAIVPPEAEILLDQLTIYGRPQEARAQLERWYDAGADTPGLLLGPNLSDAEIDFTLEALKPA